MRETGVVESTGDGTVNVRVVPSEHCEACGMCTAAGTGAMVMQGVADAHGSSIGDEVEIEVPEGSRLRGAIIGYAVPVGMLLGAYLAGFLLGKALGADPDTVGAACAGGAVIAGLLWLRRRGQTIMSKAQFQPRVSAIIRRGTPR